MSRSIPLFVSSALLWCVPRSGDRFIIAFKPAALVGAWLLSSGCKVSRSALVPGGSAFLLSVPPALVPAFQRLPSGGGGSRHPSNALPF